jgi:hypothetical protein
MEDTLTHDSEHPDAPTLEERRQLLMLLMQNRDNLADLTGILGDSALPLVIQAIAAELVTVSLREVELVEQVEVLRGAVAVLGGLTIRVPDERPQGPRPRHRRGHLRCGRGRWHGWRHHRDERAQPPTADNRHR